MRDMDYETAKYVAEFAATPGGRKFREWLQGYLEDGNKLLNAARQGDPYQAGFNTGIATVISKMGTAAKSVSAREAAATEKFEFQ